MLSHSVSIMLLVTGNVFTILRISCVLLYIVTVSYVIAVLQACYYRFHMFNLFGHTLVGVLWTLLMPASQRPLPASTNINQTKPKDISLNLTGLPRELWPLPGLHPPDSHSVNHGKVPVICVSFDISYYENIMIIHQQFCIAG
jgi:hypothetical protein